MPSIGEAAQQDLALNARLSGDLQTAEIRFTIDGAQISIAAADAKVLDELIAHLGAIRSKMNPGVQNDLIPDVVYPLADYDPRWEIAPDSQNQFATLWIRHPGFGWSGFGFPRHEAGNIAKWLRRVTTITATQEAQSPSATTFGRDEFLLTTEGLGFYYYGRGETRIGPNPFEQMEFDSDRAAAIVAGSIVEQRLEQALRSRMKANKPKETGDIFRSSGPLGSFSSKIAISYLLGMLSDDAHHDVLILKNVRNDFAHKLDFDHFDLPSSKDRCKRLILVDRHVGPVPDPSEIGKPDAVLLASPYLGLPDFEEKLADPRFRYTMTAQLVSSELGMAADNPHRPLPFV